MEFNPMKEKVIPRVECKSQEKRQPQIFVNNCLVLWFDSQQRWSIDKYLK